MDDKPKPKLLRYEIPLLGSFYIEKKLDGFTLTGFTLWHNGCLIHTDPTEDAAIAYMKSYIIEQTTKNVEAVNTKLKLMNDVLQGTEQIPRWWELYRQTPC